MERYAFSRAADHVSIKYTVRSLKLQRAVTFLYYLSATESFCL